MNKFIYEQYIFLHGMELTLLKVNMTTVKHLKKTESL